jgi:hypothetical protein
MFHIFLPSFTFSPFSFFPSIPGIFAISSFFAIFFPLPLFLPYTFLPSFLPPFTAFFFISSHYSLFHSTFHFVLPYLLLYFFLCTPKILLMRSDETITKCELRKIRQEGVLAFAEVMSQPAPKETDEYHNQHQLYNYSLV